MSKSEYIHAPETAKLIRAALKKAFPGQKFYVRSGGSIDVYWMDGPTTKEVDKIVTQYEGSRFDGFIDLRYGLKHWLLPDGTTQIARDTGTGGSRGSIPGGIDTTDTPPHPDARLVSFMADFVFTRKAHSPEHVEKIGRAISLETGWEMPKIGTIEWWVAGKRKGDLRDAHFEVDYLKLVPGSPSMILADHYNRELRKT